MTGAPAVVSLHALDAGGGEGLVADAAVFAELDCRALCVATSVLSGGALPAPLVAGQLDAARRIAPIAAVRIGFLMGAAQVALAAAFAAELAPETSVAAWPGPDAETKEAIQRRLFPAVRVVVARAADLVPPEARGTDDFEALRAAARRLRDRGARAVLVAGLVARGRVLDLLDDTAGELLLDVSRIQAPHVPGLTGAHAAALAAHLARGLTLPRAAEAAQRYVGFRLRRGR